MNRKKRFLGPLITLIIIAGVIAAVCYYFYQKNSTKAVDVFPVSSMSTQDWGSGSAYSASVTKGRIQNVILKEGLVNEVCVSENDTVREGDVLLVYDQTAVELALNSDQAKISVLQSQIDKGYREIAYYNNLLPSEYAPEGSEEIKDNGPLELKTVLTADDCMADSAYNCSLETVIKKEFLQKLRANQWTVTVELYDNDTSFATFVIDGSLIPETTEAYEPFATPTPTVSPEPKTPTPAPKPETPTPTPRPETPTPTSEPETQTPTPEPVTETPEPVTETPEPVTETPEPVTETPEPVTETPEPVTETPEPVTETPEPVTETPEPVTETPEPVTETPEPVSETPEPVTETPEPVTETPEPVTETPEPEPTEPAEGSFTAAYGSEPILSAALYVRYVPLGAPETPAPTPAPDTGLYIKVKTDPLSEDWLISDIVSFNGDGADFTFSGEKSYYGTLSSHSPMFYEQFETIYSFPDYDPDSDHYRYSKADLASMIAQKQKDIEAWNIELRSAYVALEQDQLLSRDGTVRAALDGIVTKAVDLKTAKAGDTVITVRGTENYRITVYVNELELNRIRPGDTLSGNAYESGALFTGIVTEIGDKPADENPSYGGNPNSSLYPVIASVNETDIDMVVGEACEVRFDSAEEEPSSDTFYIPSMYIRSDERGSYVYRAENNVLKKEYILTGKSLWGYYTEIRSGLSADDYIAFPYGKTVTDGTPVQISENGMYY